MSGGNSSAWWDVDFRAKRLEKIIKDCLKQYEKNFYTNDTMAESYFERIMKCEKLIQPYVAEFTGVKKLLRAGNKLETSSEQILR